jgi:hypothetical protein
MKCDLIFENVKYWKFTELEKLYYFRQFETEKETLKL